MTGLRARARTTTTTTTRTRENNKKKGRGGNAPVLGGGDVDDTRERRIPCN